MASNLQKSTRNINVENPQTVPKKASTALAVGVWLEYDGAGGAQLLEPGSHAILGLNLSPIAATDPDYSSTKLITYDGVVDTTDRFLMPVTTGTALSSMVGSPFDVDTNGYGLDVSGSGVQFEVTKFISATLVEVKVLLTK